MKFKRDFIGMFDVLKGILMILIVLIHTADFILAVMPAGGGAAVTRGLMRYSSVFIVIFFILAGYSFRPPADIGAYIKKQARQLLVPYGIIVISSTALRTLLFTAISGRFRLQEISSGILGGLYGCVLPFELFGRVWAGGIVALWFLLALFFGNVIYALLWRLKNQRLTIFLIWTLSAAAALFPPVETVQLPWCIVQSCAVLGFLEIGRLLRKYKILYRRFHPLLLVPVLGVWVLAYLFSEANVAANLWRFGPVDYAVSSAVAAAVVILYTQSGLAVARFTGLTAYIGRYSLWVLFLHSFELLAIPWNGWLGGAIQRLGIPFGAAIFLLCALRVGLICAVIWIGKVVSARRFGRF